MLVNTFATTAYGTNAKRNIIINH